jgi:hypothetical protein
MEGSGAEVTDVVGAAADFSCWPLWPRRIVRAGIVVIPTGATEAWTVSARPSRRVKSQ